MELSEDQRFELLKLEMGLLQTTLDKYDDLIFRNRSWFITLWMGTMALGLTKSEYLVLGSAFISVLFWFFEGMMRHQYLYKYVNRYRTIREYLNRKHDKKLLSVYDLTNHCKKPKDTTSDFWKKYERLVKSFFKIEPIVVYGCLTSVSLFIFCMLQSGAIRLVG